ncbi:oxidoreductase [Streptomyces pilosus]|uniref:SDR family NAD(P)-dependent oxidoreductase n=1 Tax=Streptomyces pilosus TaxID=28893 RepID=UPI0016722A6F|nr:SDR family NAD(P)-dependent oxidoreductase [Streptomyces pilosus]GGV45830.1 oxidoreductase [Streptomyces pilosus]
MTSPSEAFSGGTAVITGAAAGIGAGLARHAALVLGMRVVIADIDEQALEQTCAELTEDGGKATTALVDVREAAAVEGLADRVAEEFGPVRLLVNNAGLEQFGYLWDTPVANWERLVAVNINGVFHGIRAFLPRMLRQSDPAWVLNLSSVGAVTAVPMQAPYIMSKHAVLALTECLHQEVALAGAAHIHVGAVLPGAVVSRIFDTAGGVEGGDLRAAEEAREAMFRVRERAIGADEAAETILRQAAEKEFYIVTQPETVFGVMRERAAQLTVRSAPALPRGSRFTADAGR